MMMPSTRHQAESFKYDPFGRRIEKSSSSETSVYAYDGNNLVEETNSSGAAVVRYVQTNSIDEPLALLRSATTSYYQADGLGSVTSLTNTAGAAAQTYTYDSFGNTVASSGSLVNSFRYTGREFDTETSLYYYRARYYDPATGRFTSEDPIRFRAGVNFYRYVKNSVTNLMDPYGLACFAGGVPASLPIAEGAGLPCRPRQMRRERSEEVRRTQRQAANGIRVLFSGLPQVQSAGQHAACCKA